MYQKRRIKTVQVPIRWVSSELSSTLEVLLILFVFRVSLCQILTGLELVPTMHVHTAGIAVAVTEVKTTLYWLLLCEKRQLDFSFQIK